MNKPQEVKVVWFNNLKGYGKGETQDGKKIFLHYTSFPECDKYYDGVGDLDAKTIAKFSPKEDQKVWCVIKKDKQYGLVSHTTYKKLPK